MKFENSNGEIAPMVPARRLMNVAKISRQPATLLKPSLICEAR
jgi:hypothetical protein